MLQGKQLAKIDEVTYTSSGNAKVMGWIVKPPTFDASKKYPLILEIHGGPFGNYNVGFNYMFQNFAANGFVVLYTNPRGSTGYGSDFINGIDHNYPGPDYDDLMAGVDTVVGKGYIDTSRMYVSGCSGGGVLSSWVIGKTDRFAAAAVRCPVIDWISMAGHTDVPLFTYSFFKKPFWEDPSDWLAHSSLMTVGKVTTPTLLMTGVLDRRTPMPQTEEYYAALKVKGVPVKLLQFNEEYHGTGSKPSNYIRTQLYMMSWFNQWTRAAGGRVDDCRAAVMRIADRGLKRFDHRSMAVRASRAALGRRSTLRRRRRRSPPFAPAGCSIPKPAASSPTRSSSSRARRSPTSGRTSRFPAGAQVIDLSRMTVMPGLVEAHNHLALTYKPDPENNIYYYTYVQESTALRAIQAASNGIQMLASGFTIVRDMGNNALYADTALRQAIEQGWIPGPTIINSGIIIGGMGGQFFPTPEMAQQHNIVYPEYLDADTPDEIVKAVRQNVLFGAKVIKICVDCKPYGYTADEIRLFIREAAKAGMKVEGHVQTLNGAKNAIEAGIWSIAHSTGLNEEMHTLMAQKGICRAGTDTPDTLAGHPVSPQAYQRNVASLKDAYAKKVPLTFSTDADYYVAGKTRGEVCMEFLKTWKDAGHSERRHPARDDDRRLQGEPDREHARPDQGRASSPTSSPCRATRSTTSTR